MADSTVATKRPSESRHRRRTTATQVRGSKSSDKKRGTGRKKHGFAMKTITEEAVGSKNSHTHRHKTHHLSTKPRPYTKEFSVPKAVPSLYAISFCESHSFHCNTSKQGAHTRAESPKAHQHVLLPCAKTRIGKISSLDRKAKKCRSNTDIANSSIPMDHHHHHRREAFMTYHHPSIISTTIIKQNIVSKRRAEVVPNEKQRSSHHVLTHRAHRSSSPQHESKEEMEVLGHQHQHHHHHHHNHNHHGEGRITKKHKKRKYAESIKPEHSDRKLVQLHECARRKSKSPEREKTVVKDTSQHSLKRYRRKSHNESNTSKKRKNVDVPEPKINNQVPIEDGDVFKARKTRRKSISQGRHSTHKVKSGEYKRSKSRAEETHKHKYAEDTSHNKIKVHTNESPGRARSPRKSSKHQSKHQCNMFRFLEEANKYPIHICEELLTRGKKTRPMIPRIELGSFEIPPFQEKADKKHVHTKRTGFNIAPKVEREGDKDGSPKIPYTTIIDNRTSSHRRSRRRHGNHCFQYRTPDGFVSSYDSHDTFPTWDTSFTSLKETSNLMIISEMDSVSETHAERGNIVKEAKGGVTVIPEPLYIAQNYDAYPVYDIELDKKRDICTQGTNTDIVWTSSNLRVEEASLEQVDVKPYICLSPVPRSFCKRILRNRMVASKRVKRATKRDIRFVSASKQKKKPNVDLPSEPPNVVSNIKRDLLKLPSKIPRLRVELRPTTIKYQTIEIPTEIPSVPDRKLTQLFQGLPPFIPNVYSNLASPIFSRIALNQSMVNLDEELIEFPTTDDAESKFNVKAETLISRQNYAIDIGGSLSGMSSNVGSNHTQSTPETISVIELKPKDESFDNESKQSCSAISSSVSKSISLVAQKIAAPDGITHTCKFEVGFLKKSDSVPSSLRSSSLKRDLPPHAILLPALQFQTPILSSSHMISHINKFPEDMASGGYQEVGPDSKFIINVMTAPHKIEKNTVSLQVLAPMKNVDTNTSTMILKRTPRTTPLKSRLPLPVNSIRTRSRLPARGTPRNTYTFPIEIDLNRVGQHLAATNNCATRLGSASGANVNSTCVFCRYRNCTKYTNTERFSARNVCYITRTAQVANYACPYRQDIGAEYHQNNKFLLRNKYYPLAKTPSKFIATRCLWRKLLRRIKNNIRFERRKRRERIAQHSGGNKDLYVVYSHSSAYSDIIDISNLCGFKNLKPKGHRLAQDGNADQIVWSGHPTEAYRHPFHQELFFAPALILAQENNDPMAISLNNSEMATIYTNPLPEVESELQVAIFNEFENQDDIGEGEGLSVYSLFFDSETTTSAAERLAIDSVLLLKWNNTRQKQSAPNIEPKITQVEPPVTVKSHSDSILFETKEENIDAVVKQKEFSPVVPILREKKKSSRVVTIPEMHIRTPIHVSITGMTYFSFKSVLRNYTLELEELRVLTPCVKGHMQKAPRVIVSSSIEPRPILKPLASQICEIDQTTLIGEYIFPEIETATENVIRESTDDTLPNAVEVTTDLDVFSPFMFEIHPLFGIVESFESATRVSSISTITSPIISKSITGSLSPVYISPARSPVQLPTPKVSDYIPTIITIVQPPISKRSDYTLPAKRVQPLISKGIDKACICGGKCFCDVVSRGVQGDVDRCATKYSKVDVGTTICPASDDDFVITLELLVNERSIRVAFQEEEYVLILPPIADCVDCCGCFEHFDIYSHVFFDHLFEVLCKNGTFLRKIRDVLIHSMCELLGIGPQRSVALEFIRDVLRAILNFDETCYLDAVWVKEMELKYRAYWKESDEIDNDDISGHLSIDIMNETEYMKQFNKPVVLEEMWNSEIDGKTANEIGYVSLDESAAINDKIFEEPEVIQEIYPSVSKENIFKNENIEKSDAENIEQIETAAIAERETKNIDDSTSENIVQTYTETIAHSETENSEQAETENTKQPEIEHLKQTETETNERSVINFNLQMKNIFPNVGVDIISDNCFEEEFLREIHFLERQSTYININSPISSIPLLTRTSFENIFTLNYSYSCTTLQLPVSASCVEAASSIKHSRSCHIFAKNVSFLVSGSPSLQIENSSGDTTSMTDNTATSSIKQHASRRSKPTSSSPSIELERYYNNCDFFVRPPIVQYFYSCNETLVRHPPVILVLAQKFLNNQRNILNLSRRKAKTQPERKAKPTCENSHIRNLFKLRKKCCKSYKTSRRETKVKVPKMDKAEKTAKSAKYRLLSKGTKIKPKSTGLSCSCSAQAISNMDRKCCTGKKRSNANKKSWISRLEKLGFKSRPDRDRKRLPTDATNANEPSTSCQCKSGSLSFTPLSKKNKKKKKAGCNCNSCKRNGKPTWESRRNNSIVHFDDSGNSCCGQQNKSCIDDACRCRKYAESSKRKRANTRFVKPGQRSGEKGFESRKSNKTTKSGEILKRSDFVKEPPDFLMTSESNKIEEIKTYDTTEFDTTSKSSETVKSQYIRESDEVSKYSSRRNSGENQLNDQKIPTRDNAVSSAITCIEAPRSKLQDCCCDENCPRIKLASSVPGFHGRWFGRKRYHSRRRPSREVLIVTQDLPPQKHEPNKSGQIQTSSSQVKKSKENRLCAELIFKANVKSSEVKNSSLTIMSISAKSESVMETKLPLNTQLEDKSQTLTENNNNNEPIQDVELLADQVVSKNEISATLPPSHITSTTQLETVVQENVLIDESHLASCPQNSNCCIPTYQTNTMISMTVLADQKFILNHEAETFRHVTDDIQTVLSFKPHIVKPSWFQKAFAAFRKTSSKYHVAPAVDERNLPSGFTQTNLTVIPSIHYPYAHFGHKNAPNNLGMKVLKRCECRKTEVVARASFPQGSEHTQTQHHNQMVDSESTPCICRNAKIVAHEPPGQIVGQKPHQGNLQNTDKIAYSIQSLKSPSTVRNPVDNVVHQTTEVENEAGILLEDTEDINKTRQNSAMILTTEKIKPNIDAEVITRRKKESAQLLEIWSVEPPNSKVFGSFSRPLQYSKKSNTRSGYRSIQERTEKLKCPKKTCRNSILQKQFKCKSPEENIRLITIENLNDTRNEMTLPGLDFSQQYTSTNYVQTDSVSDIRPTEDSMSIQGYNFMKEPSIFPNMLDRRLTYEQIYRVSIICNTKSTQTIGNPLLEIRSSLELLRAKKNLLMVGGSEVPDTAGERGLLIDNGPKLKDDPKFSFRPKLQPKSPSKSSCDHGASACIRPSGIPVPEKNRREKKSNLKHSQIYDAYGTKFADSSHSLQTRLYPGNIYNSGPPIALKNKYGTCTKEENNHKNLLDSKTIFCSDDVLDKCVESTITLDRVGQELAEKQEKSFREKGLAWHEFNLSEKGAIITGDYLVSHGKCKNKKKKCKQTPKLLDSFKKLEIRVTHSDKNMSSNCCCKELGPAKGNQIKQTLTEKEVLKMDITSYSPCYEMTLSGPSAWEDRPNISDETPPWVNLRKNACSHLLEVVGHAIKKKTRKPRAQRCLWPNCYIESTKLAFKKLRNKKFKKEYPECSSPQKQSNVNKISVEIPATQRKSNKVSKSSTQKSRSMQKGTVNANSDENIKKKGRKQSLRQFKASYPKCSWLAVANLSHKVPERKLVPKDSLLVTQAQIKRNSVSAQLATTIESPESLIETKKNPTTLSNYIFDQCCDAETIDDFYNLSLTDFLKKYPECCWPRILPEIKSSEVVTELINKVPEKAVSPSPMGPSKQKMLPYTEKIAEPNFNKCCDEIVIEDYGRLPLKKFKKLYADCCWPTENEASTKTSKFNKSEKKARKSEKSPLTEKKGDTYSPDIFAKCTDDDVKQKYFVMDRIKFSKEYPEDCQLENSIIEGNSNGTPFTGYTNISPEKEIVHCPLNIESQIIKPEDKSLLLIQVRKTKGSGVQENEDKPYKYIFKLCCGEEIQNKFFRVGIEAFKKEYTQCCWPSFEWIHNDENKIENDPYWDKLIKLSNEEPSILQHLPPSCRNYLEKYKMHKGPHKKTESITPENPLQHNHLGPKVHTSDQTELNNMQMTTAINTSVMQLHIIHSLRSIGINTSVPRITQTPFESQIISALHSSHAPSRGKITPNKQSTQRSTRTKISTAIIKHESSQDTKLKGPSPVAKNFSPKQQDSRATTMSGIKTIHSSDMPAHSSQQNAKNKIVPSLSSARSSQRNVIKTTKLLSTKNSSRTTAKQKSMSNTIQGLLYSNRARGSQEDILEKAKNPQLQSASTPIGHNEGKPMRWSSLLTAAALRGPTHSMQTYDSYNERNNQLQPKLDSISLASNRHTNESKKSISVNELPSTHARNLRVQTRDTHITHNQLAQTSQYEPPEIMMPTNEDSHLMETNHHSSALKIISSPPYRSHVPHKENDGKNQYSSSHGHLYENHDATQNSRSVIEKNTMSKKAATASTPSMLRSYGVGYPMHAPVKSSIPDGGARDIIPISRTKTPRTQSVNSHNISTKPSRRFSISVPVNNAVGNLTSMQNIKEPATGEIITENVDSAATVSPRKLSPKENITATSSKNMINEGHSSKNSNLSSHKPTYRNASVQYDPLIECTSSVSEGKSLSHLPDFDPFRKFPLSLQTIPPSERCSIAQLDNGFPARRAQRTSTYSAQSTIQELIVKRSILKNSNAIKSSILSFADETVMPVPNEELLYKILNRDNYLRTPNVSATSAPPPSPEEMPFGTLESVIHSISSMTKDELNFLLRPDKELDGERTNRTPKKPCFCAATQTADSLTVVPDTCICKPDKKRRILKLCKCTKSKLQVLKKHYPSKIVVDGCQCKLLPKTDNHTVQTRPKIIIDTISNYSLLDHIDTYFGTQTSVSVTNIVHHRQRMKVPSRNVCTNIAKSSRRINMNLRRKISTTRVTTKYIKAMIPFTSSYNPKTILKNRDFERKASSSGTIRKSVTMGHVFKRRIVARHSLMHMHDSFSSRDKIGWSVKAQHSLLLDLDDGPFSKPMTHNTIKAHLFFDKSPQKIAKNITNQGEVKTLHVNMKSRKMSAKILTRIANDEPQRIDIAKAGCQNRVNDKAHQRNKRNTVKKWFKSLLPNSKIPSKLVASAVVSDVQKASSKYSNESCGTKTINYSFVDYPSMYANLTASAYSKTHQKSFEGLCRLLGEPLTSCSEDSVAEKVEELNQAVSPSNRVIPIKANNVKGIVRHIQIDTSTKGISVEPPIKCSANLSHVLQTTLNHHHDMQTTDSTTRSSPHISETRSLFRRIFHSLNKKMKNSLFKLRTHRKHLMPMTVQTFLKENLHDKDHDSNFMQQTCRTKEALLTEQEEQDCNGQVHKDIAWVNQQICNKCCEGALKILMDRSNQVKEKLQSTLQRVIPSPNTTDSTTVRFKSHILERETGSSSGSSSDTSSVNCESTTTSFISFIYLNGSLQHSDEGTTLIRTQREEINFRHHIIQQCKRIKNEERERRRQAIYTAIHSSPLLQMECAKIIQARRTKQGATSTSLVIDSIGSSILPDLDGLTTYNSPLTVSRHNYKNPMPRASLLLSDESLAINTVLVPYDIGLLNKTPDLELVHPNSLSDQTAFTRDQTIKMKRQGEHINFSLRFNDNNDVDTNSKPFTLEHLSDTSYSSKEQEYILNVHDYDRYDHSAPFCDNSSTIRKVIIRTSKNWATTVTSTSMSSKPQILLPGTQTHRTYEHDNCDIESYTDYERRIPCYFQPNYTHNLQHASSRKN